MMATMETRFGEVEYDPANNLTFVKGLAGFEDLKEFVVMPNRKEGPLFWIQSVEAPDIAFVLTDPTNFFLDYSVVPEEAERKKLELGSDDPCFILSIVTVRQDKTVTLNLQAPILYNPKNNKVMQVILEGSSYRTQHELPKVEPKA